MAGDSALNLPFINVGFNGVSSATLPAIIIGGYGNSSATLPRTLVTGYSESVKTLPAVIAVGVGASAPQVTLPLITASSTGVTGSITVPSQPVLIVPAVQGTGTGAPGVLGESDAALPLITGVSSGLAISIEDVPALTGSGAGLLGQIGASGAFAPRIGATGTATTIANGVSTEPTPLIEGASIGLLGQIGSSTLSSPVIVPVGAAVTIVSGASSKSVLQILGSGAGLSGAAGASGLILRRIVVASIGQAGSLGQSVLVLPQATILSAGHVLSVGTSSLLLPMLVPVSQGITGVTASYSTITMHTETMALTTYSNFPFNSMAAFNETYLAAGDNGLFLLTGTDDAGVPIDAAARTGISGFGDSYQKRVPRVYIGGRFDNDMTVRVFTDEVSVRDYLMRTTGASGMHGNHVKIGKGVKARYWQFEVQNQNGGDFDLDAIEVKPMMLKRRIGGSDA